jgi:hypothetical protein
VKIDTRGSVVSRELRDRDGQIIGSVGDANVRWLAIVSLRAPDSPPRVSASSAASIAQALPDRHAVAVK